MKQLLLAALALFVGANAYAQNKFEQGYFIRNNGTKVTCLIKNDDWSDNPTSFVYKTDENGSEQTGQLALIKEFAVVSAHKYLRYEVDIDRSSNNITKMSTKRTPVFTKEKLFLRVLIAGSSASLYSYTDGSLRRYFYKTSTVDVKQLVYKQYRSGSGKISVNDLYKKQLRSDMPCSTEVGSPSYSRNFMIKYVTNFNNCQNTDASLVDYTATETKGQFGLRIKAGGNFSSVKVTELGSSIGGSTRTSETGNQTNVRFGVELEYMLPLNNNRWSVFIEPTYQSFAATAVGPTGSLGSAGPSFDIDYASVEIPIGVRYYFPIKEQSDVFVNGGIILDAPSSSTVRNFDVRSSTDVFLGAGYQFQKKFTAEIRYHIGRELLSDYIAVEAKYSGFAINLGYRIF